MGTEFIIVGEKLNTSRKHVRKAVEERDAEFIKKETVAQAAAGAKFIDVNAGTNVASEASDLVWMTELVQSVTNLPCCIDSPNPEAIAKALAVHKGKALINSITPEKARLDGIVPLVRQYNTDVVALLMGEGVCTTSAQERLQLADLIVKRIEKEGIALDRVYFDPAVYAIATDPRAGLATIETIRELKRTYPQAKTICGLSNVSFGLPNRRLLNRTYLAMLVEAGLDGAIMDPTDVGMVSALYAARALTGRDEYCMEYITGHRENKLE